MNANKNFMRNDKQSFSLAKYLAIPLLAIALSACNSGSTTPSSTSSTTASSSITPIGALLVPSGAVAETYKTEVNVPASKTLQSVAVINAATGASSTAITASVAPDETTGTSGCSIECGSFNTSCVPCPEVVSMTVNPAAAIDYDTLISNMLVATYSDGTTNNYPLTIRKLEAEEEEVVAAAPAKIHVQLAAAEVDYVVPVLNNTNRVQNLDLSKMRLAGLPAGATIAFNFTDGDAAKTKTIAPGEAAGIRVRIKGRIFPTTVNVPYALQYDAEVTNDAGASKTVYTTTTLTPSTTNSGLSYNGDEVFVTANSARTVSLANVGSSVISHVAAVNSIPGLGVNTNSWDLTNPFNYGQVALTADSSFSGDNVQSITTECGFSSSISCMVGYVSVSTTPITLSSSSLKFTSSVDKSQIWVSDWDVSEAAEMSYTITGADAASFEASNTVNTLSYSNSAPVNVSYVGDAHSIQNATLVIIATTASKTYRKEVNLTSGDVILPENGSCSNGYSWSLNSEGIFTDNENNTTQKIYYDTNGYLDEAQSPEFQFYLNGDGTTWTLQNVIENVYEYSLTCTIQ